MTNKKQNEADTGLRAARIIRNFLAVYESPDFETNLSEIYKSLIHSYKRSDPAVNWQSLMDCFESIEEVLPAIYEFRDQFCSTSGEGDDPAKSGRRLPFRNLFITISNRSNA